MTTTAPARLSAGQKAAITRAANAVARATKGDASPSNGQATAGQKAALTRKANAERGSKRKAAYSPLHPAERYAGRVRDHVTDLQSTAVAPRHGVGFTVLTFRHRDTGLFEAVIFRNRDRVPACGQFDKIAERSAFVAEQVRP